MAAGSVNIVTQTRVEPRHTDDFTRWQDHLNEVIAKAPGYISYQVIPPQPPAQVDWVIIQRFATIQSARDWINSDVRQKLVADILPILVGPDDIHIIPSDDNIPQTSVTAIISVHIKPGQEDELRSWVQRIGAAEARFPGFQGSRVEPPITGVQNDWTTVVRFDTEEHLNAWMTSPERQRLLKEAAPFIADTHYRTVSSGFEQWFRLGAPGVALPPVWKQNMITLLALYPVVFLFGHFVQNPILHHRFGMPFFGSLFVSNIASVLILTILVPWASKRFGWWLDPTTGEPREVTIRGAVTIVALYALFLIIFSQVR